MSRLATPTVSHATDCTLATGCQACSSVRCILYVINYFNFLFHSHGAINFDHVSLSNVIEYFFFLYIGTFVCIYLNPIPVAARSNAWVYGHLPTEIVGSNSTGTWMTSSFECCILSGRDPCDWLIHCPEEAYRLWCVWVPH